MVGVFLWTALKSQEKRIDELRADMKDGFAQQRAAMAELKADNKALAAKLDHLVESLLTAK